MLTTSTSEPLELPISSSSFPFAPSSTALIKKSGPGTDVKEKEEKEQKVQQKTEMKTLPDSPHVEKMMSIFAQFMWNPLCKALALDICKVPELVPHMEYCLTKFLPLLDSLKQDNIGSVMKTFIQCTSKYQHLLLERNIEFLKKHDNKFVHCMCLPRVFAHPATTDSLKNEIWQHLLGLQLVASSMWEIPIPLWEAIVKLIPEQIPDRMENGSFTFPDVTPLLNNALQIMAQGSIQFDDVMKAVTHAKHLLKGGRTPGEIGPFSRLVTLMPREPPYNIFHQMYSIFEAIANLSAEELDPLFSLLGQTFNIDANDFSEEDLKDPDKVMKFLEGKANAPEIKNFLSEMSGRDPSQIGQVLQKHLGFSSLEEALLQARSLKPKKEKAPDVYDLMFHDSQSSEATVRSVPG